MSTIATPQRSICARIAQRLAKDVGAHRYSMWFDRSATLGWDDKQRRLEVAVPNRFVADWIDRNFQEQLRQAVRHELGEDVNLSVRVDPRHFSPAALTPRPDHPEVARGHSAAPAAHRARRKRPDLVLRHSLDEFVVGPNNELAFAAANRLIEDDAAQGNPLFIHGGCGLGKTHLLQGICKKMLKLKADAHVLYTTGEQFTNEFVNAVRCNKRDQFRRKVRCLDLLAVDDVHFLSGKPGTQQEFLHSFDEIELGGSRLVMAGDTHPKLIKEFNQALGNRCLRGMVVRIQHPDTDTRIRIVRALARRRGISLLETVIAVLASRCQGSVREIEGTLTKLQAIAELAQQQDRMNSQDSKQSSTGQKTNSGMGCARSREVANASQLASGEQPREPIGHVLLNRLFNAEPNPADPPRIVRIENILTVVIEQLRISRDQILGPSRHRAVVLARSLAIYLARQMTSMSYPEIAVALNRPSHSTLIAAVQRVRKQLANDTRVLLPTTMQEVRVADVIEQLRNLILRS